MNKRRYIQKKHERFLVQCYLKWHNQKYKTKYKVIDEPNPPEAIIKSTKKTTWLEVTDAFYSEEYAKDKYSYATPGEQHIPMSSGLHHSMDLKFAIHFIKVLKSKLKKTTYRKYREKYGPGILLIGIHSPWFDSGTINLMKELCSQEDWTDNTGNFKNIYRSTIKFLSYGLVHNQMARVMPI